MEHEIVFNGEVYALEVSTSGGATVAGFETYLKDVLDDPRWNPGMSVLCDHTDLDSSDLSTDDIRRIADLHLEYDRRIGDGHCAIVTGDTGTFGLARLWEGYTTGLALHTRVFLRREQGRSWLGEVVPRRARSDGPS